jgi:hypothetical protein
MSHRPLAVIVLAAGKGTRMRAPDQALGIFELFDEIRDIIRAVYGSHIQDAARKQYRPPPDNRPVISDGDLPF